jgi:DNA-binding HxlR family transcriptional regulator
LAAFYLRNAVALALAEPIGPHMNTTGTRALNNEWTLLIVRQLRRGPLGFNALARGVNAPHAPALSSRLKAMIRDGLVERTVVTLGPPAVTRYSLTPLGRDLAEPATALVDWIESNRGEVEISREKYKVLQAIEANHAEADAH